MAPSYYDPASPDEQPVPLPSAPLVKLAPNAILQPPLTRRGYGPGLIVFLPPVGSFEISNRAKPLDPEPVQKWAEEGFAVVGVTRGKGWTVKEALRNGMEVLITGTPEVDVKDKIGIVVYDPHILASILEIVPIASPFACIVSYGAHSPSPPLDLLCHVPNDHEPPGGTHTTNYHVYSTPSPFFALPNGADYHSGSAAAAHTRSIVFLRKHTGGPHFDLEAIWDEHKFFEFGARSVAKTMGTMVAEPYVNHVPTRTGGMGRENVAAFYRDKFIFSNPADTALESVSRTVGADRIVDEFILTMTHDQVVDPLLPGVPPTGKKLTIPMVSVVNVRGDRLCHEHIWWDQAGLLLQAGVIPTHVPYPLAVPMGMLRLPISGAESARLLADETAGGTNTMFGKDWGISRM